MSEGKCENRPIGINTIGSIPIKIARFLELSEPELYTGHSFHKTSATMLVDSGGDVTRLKRNTGYKSTAVAKGYINESLQNKIEISHIFKKAVKILPSTVQKRRSKVDDPLLSTSKKTRSNYLLSFKIIDVDRKNINLSSGYHS